MGGTGGGGDATVGLGGGDRDRDEAAKERVRLCVRLKPASDGDEDPVLRGVDGSETAKNDALFGVGGCLKSPQERAEATVRWGLSTFGRGCAPWRLRRMGRGAVCLRGGRERRENDVGGGGPRGRAVCAGAGRKEGHGG